MNSPLMSGNSAIKQRGPSSEGGNCSTQTVLVVDDSPTVIALVDETLRAAYHVQVATSGPQALALLARAPAVDLILLDVMMPEMDGFEVCRRIKTNPANPAWRDIPIIFLTALSEYGDEARGLGLGAVDYIAKPVVPVTLRARVDTHAELCRVRRELQEKNDLLSAEREIIEGMILRMRADPAFNDRHLRWLMRPVERTSGDICLAAFCPDGRQMVLVGDFAGHGLTAAIAGPWVSQAFYALCAKGDAGATLTEFLTTLNALLRAQLLAGQFMAAHLVEVDPARRRLRLWGGGMPEPLHVGLDGMVRRIALASFPLGLLPEPDLSADVRTLDVREGERLLLYTDGIVEASNAAGALYEIERLEASYATLLSDGGPLAELVAAVDAFVAGRAQADDMLLLELNL